MNWLRWYHGSVTDPKFATVAQRAKTSRANVISVWAYLLETASQTNKRGDVTRCDAEDAAMALDLEKGLVEAIFDAMRKKRLIENGRLAGWDKRQPKREDSNRERTRVYRDRLALVTQCDDSVTRKKGPLLTPKKEAPLIPPKKEHPFTTPKEDSIKNTDSAEMESFLNDFNLWWECVPQKIGVGRARRAFKTALKKTDLETLIVGIKKYAKSVADNPEFIAHPATWLNGERWLDEPVQERQSWREL